MSMRFGDHSRPAKECSGPTGPLCEAATASFATVSGRYADCDRIRVRPYWPAGPWSLGCNALSAYAPTAFRGVSATTACRACPLRSNSNVSFRPAKCASRHSMVRGSYRDLVGCGRGKVLYILRLGICALDCGLSLQLEKLRSCSPPYAVSQLSTDAFTA